MNVSWILKMDNQTSQKNPHTLKKLRWEWSLLVMRASVMSFSFLYLPSHVAFVLLGDAILDPFFGVFDQLVFRLAEKPADRYFAFGYGKFQHGWQLLRGCCALVIDLLLAARVVTFFPKLDFHSFPLSAALMAGAMLLTVGSLAFDRSGDPQRRNVMVEVKFQHHWRMCFAYLVALSSSWLLYQGYRWFDVSCALVGLAAMGWGALKTARQGLENLCDRQLPAQQLILLRQALKDAMKELSFSVWETGQIRSRRSGSKQFVEVELAFPETDSIQKAVAHVAYLKDQLRNLFSDMDLTFVIKTLTPHQLMVDKNGHLSDGQHSSSH